MTAALLAGPGALASLCLILFVTPWLERLTGSPEPAPITVYPDPPKRLEGPAIVRIIGVREGSPSCTSA